MTNRIAGFGSHTCIWIPSEAQDPCEMKFPVQSMPGDGTDEITDESMAGPAIASRAMVDQAREGLCYQRRNLTFLICLT